MENYKLHEIRKKNDIVTVIFVKDNLWILKTKDLNCSIVNDHNKYRKITLHCLRKDESGNMWFEQDGATSHFSVIERKISRNRDDN